jgi:hypothetical protein
MNGKAFMLFSKSTDGGNTWSEPTIMAKITLSEGGVELPVGQNARNQKVVS